MGKIIITGSLNVDITGYMRKFPDKGETVHGKAVAFGPGGKGTNQATAAHRSGAEVKMVGMIGNDFLTEVLLDHYRGEGMSTEYIKRSDKFATGCALIEVQETDGQNRIAVIPGANMEITAADISEAEKEFSSAKVFLTQMETTDESIAEGIRLARKYGLITILNPAPARRIAPEVLDGLDYITPNETEAELLTGIKIDTVEDMIKSASVFAELGVKNTVITLGSRGLFFSDGKESVIIPAVKLKALDTTGAGDAFNGAFAAALSEGTEPSEALKFATAAAALSVTKYGAASAMPYRNETDKFLKENF